MRRMVLAMLVSLAVNAEAQTLAPSPLVSVDVLRGYELVGPIRLTPETPGDELLFRNSIWRHIVLVAVPHASKSGVGGLVPTPGLCIEPAQAFDVFDPQIAVVDVNGDGRQDIVGTANGVAQALMGGPLTACR